MPAAAVIPALRVCSHIVAVKTPVVRILQTANKSGRSGYILWNDHAQDLKFSTESSMRAIGVSAIQWRTVECSDPLERSGSEGY